MNITNASRELVERTPGNPAVALISITDPSQAKARLQSGWLDVLRVSFHDIGAEHFPASPENRVKYLPMTQLQASQVATFLRVHHAAHVLVHCEAGISRSFAVARAAADSGTHAYLGPGGIANDHVYRLVYSTLKALP
jgi:predicted protein tyrosine phosphatase